MNKEHMIKRQGAGFALARSNRDADAADRSRITAGLREQRLKRDAEIVIAPPAAKKMKRQAK